MRYILLVVFVIIGSSLFAQDNPPSPAQESNRPSKPGNFDKKRGRSSESSAVTIKDYKIISFERDTTFLATFG